VYDLDISEKDELVCNDYSYLNEKSISLKKDNCIYFLGGPLSEVGVMSEEDYFEQLNEVREKHSGMKFVYVAHRREKTRKLNKIRDYLNIEVCFFEYPIEYQVAIVGPVPEIIASFVTSALENLRVIMGGKMKIISYKLIDGTYSNAERIESIYSSYAKNVSENFCLETLESKENHKK
jgi:hypothetical protein